jgi:hypothetical protein
MTVLLSSKVKPLLLMASGTAAIRKVITEKEAVATKVHAAQRGCAKTATRRRRCGSAAAAEPLRSPCSGPTPRRSSAKSIA